MELKGLVVAGLSGTVLAVGAATNISYSPTGTGPYAWETVENWYKAGEAYGQLPVSTDLAYLQTNTLANQTVVLNSGTTADLYGLYLGNTSVPVTLEVEEGATLKTGHSSYAYGIGSLLHVKSGGLFCINSFLSFGANGSSAVRLLIDEGGTFTNSTGVLRAPGHRNAKAVIENHGLFSIVDASVGVGFSPSRDSSCTGYCIFDNYGRVESDNHASKRFEVGAGSYVKGYLTNRVDATIDLSMPLTVGGSSNATGYVCNYGTINVKNKGVFYVGGDSINSTGGVKNASYASRGYVDNYGTMNLTTLNIGNWNYCTGTFTNHSNATLKVSGDLQLAVNKQTVGTLVLDEGSMTAMDGKKVYIATSDTTSSGTLTLRGGTLQLVTNSVVYVGRNSTSASACNGFIRGWGLIDRIGKKEYNGSSGSYLRIYGGAIMADGEGELRDLDLSVFRQVDNNGTNLSGTNGWYAINKGRLYYPCRSSGYVNLGDYYSRADGPYYVNGVKFAFTGADSTMRLHGQLYATDRDDIPEGLPEDDVAAGVKRLGVWRAGLFTSSFSERILADDPDVKTVAFTKATAKIRYDNFRLNELKDENGDFRNGQLVRLYRYTGTEWQIVTTLKAEDAETDHLISGELKPVDERWNMGFFAVVAVRNPGTTILIR